MDHLPKVNSFHHSVQHDLPFPTKPFHLEQQETFPAETRCPSPDLQNSGYFGTAYCAVLIDRRQSSLPLHYRFAAIYFFVISAILEYPRLQLHAPRRLPNPTGLWIAPSGGEVRPAPCSHS